MSDRRIHGLAVPFNEPIAPFASDRGAQCFAHTFTVRPGAFTDALARIDTCSRLTAFDHAYDLEQWPKSILANVRDGSLTYWQAPAGLMFEATIASKDPKTSDRV